RGAARARYVGRGFGDLDHVARVGREEQVGLSRRAGDRHAVVARAVALQPLVGEAGRFAVPGTAVLGQRLSLLGGARDRRRSFVERRRRSYDRRGARRGRAARAAGVRGDLLHLERVTHVARHRDVGLARGAGDRCAAVTRAVALQPLVGEARRVVTPFALVLGPRLALPAWSPVPLHGSVAGWRRSYDRRGARRGRAARAAGVRGDLLHLERVTHVARHRHVGLARGAGDRFAVVTRPVALQPLVGE